MDDINLAAAEAGLLAQLRESMPLRFEALDLTATRDAGLLIVDEVNGFATVGAGNLAPPVENPQVSRMVAETDRLARALSDRAQPIMAFLDTHDPGKPEPPYPPHCEAGTGEEDLVPALTWLEQAPTATLLRKDCINGFIGATRPDGSNAVADWISKHAIRQLLVVGICTDICVMDFVLTALSARNHGVLAPLEHIFVYEAGCATFHLPRGTAESLGYGASAAHPQAETHHMGLYFMASRGARLVDTVTA